MQSFKVKWGDYAMLIVDMLMNIKHFGVKLIVVLGLLYVVYTFIPKNENPEKNVGQQDLSSYQEQTPHQWLSAHYGNYEYGAANIYLDEGADDNSVYVYVSFEPTASWWVSMHGNVALDGEPHFLFRTESQSDAQSVVAEKDLIAGAMSLEPMDNGSLHMVLYKDTNDDEPYNVELIPST